MATATAAPESKSIRELYEQLKADIERRLDPEAKELRVPADLEDVVVQLPDAGDPVTAAELGALYKLERALESDDEFERLHQITLKARSPKKRR